MSETVTLIIMLSIFCTIFAVEDHDFELVKLVKRQHEDIILHCSLSENHEVFNKNITVNWYYLRTCKNCAFNSQISRKEEWIPIDCQGSCKIKLILDNLNALEGYYKCKIFPYHVDNKTTLQIEITKTFQVELAENTNTGLPEILDTQNKFKVPYNSQSVLQCRSRCNKQKPTIKWFKQKTSKTDDNDEDSSITYIESLRAIKYFENFYQPVPSSGGLKELDDHIYLSKLIINNITNDSIYVCVAINYYGFVFKEFSIEIEKNLNEDDDEENDYDSNENIELKHDDKSFELFLIPLLLFLIIIIQISTIIYLMIYRSIMKETNKHFV